MTLTISRPVTVGPLLNETIRTFQARGVVHPERWAKALVAHVVGKPYAALSENSKAELTPEQQRCYETLLPQVTADAPVAYLLGTAPFLNRDFEVTQDTLIPKVDTELFLQIIFDETAKQPLPPAPHILELCCGPGCVAVSLAAHWHGVRVVATDISPDALVVAHRNWARHGMESQIVFGEGDLFAPVAEASNGRPFDLIVSNPPYIPTGNIAGMGRFVAKYEPKLALDGGQDGLAPHRRMLEQGPQFLAPKGRMFLEHEYYSGASARELAAQTGNYDEIETFQDANGKDRALYVRLKS